MSARKQRVDVLLVELGHFESRARAKAAIMAGLVRVGADHVIRNAADKVAEDADLVVEQPFPYVSRGALKLEPSLDEHLPDLTGLVALDVGASTGGFTDLMLQRGAVRVYAVDVGTGQLHYKLRQDDRVVVHEQCNARNLSEDEVPELVDVMTADVSFISLTKILPAASRRMKADGWAFVLVKPQFEAGRDEVGKGGVVRDEAVRQRVVSEIVAFAETELGWSAVGVSPSPVKGPKGNQEFVAIFRTNLLQ